MHAHIDWRSRDCDGVMSGTYVIEQIVMGEFEESVESFTERVLIDITNLHFNPETEGPGQLEIVRTNDPNEPMQFRWSIHLEEGGESKHVMFCNQDDIVEPTRRDHTAERAGY